MATKEITRPTSPRVAQKRARARSRIVAAADRLTSERSVDEVSIKDITEAADVGQGTFYIHFKSKNDVLVPIMQAAADRLDQQLQSALSGEEDPATIVGMSARIMARRVVSDDRWRWVLENSSVPVDEFLRAFGRFVARDYQKGREGGAFVDMDPAIATSFSFGGLINVLVMSLQSSDPEHMIDRAVELSLLTLGVTPQKAARIVELDLPTIETSS